MEENQTAQPSPAEQVANAPAAAKPDAPAPGPAEQAANVINADRIAAANAAAQDIAKKDPVYCRENCGPCQKAGGCMNLTKKG